jgi:hypothetical protein
LGTALIAGHGQIGDEILADLRRFVHVNRHVRYVDLIESKVKQHRSFARQGRRRCQPDGKNVAPGAKVVTVVEKYRGPFR